ncbi:amidohydrolase family protein [Pseudomonas veronii]|uniref:amidohydrolase family protein n=1 Tax=Pseudomonas veronii TaxID=76761 RepID=UPI0021BF27B4|nr:amidohydrolase family protein [Pseudomonas veronii]MCT9824878.1 amidohydrolase family protein [Pseudomonas veronii]
MQFTRRRFIQIAGAMGAYCQVPAWADVPWSKGEELPTLKVPAGSVDSHIHLYDDRVQPVAGASLTPPTASLADYRLLQRRLGLERMVIVTPSTYGFDNSLMLEGLAQSNGNARGVAVIQTTITDEELNRLDQAGVRGIRFNLSFGGTKIEELERLASRVNELGWHVQLVSPGNQLPGLESKLLKLPCRLVIDHLGQLSQPGGVTSDDFAALSRLLATGHVWTKLSAPYNTSKSGAPEYGDFGQVASALVKLRADRLMWGSDWPHPTMKSEKPDDAQILDLLAIWAPGEGDRRLILRDNAVELYGFDA